ncbi:T-cell surface glycoprotein CD3 epsilon chain isoform 1 precursor [Salmo salar]|uniref:CD3epsilon n=1 Tax=Salmo salar TaxID=8030 RepID=A3RK72_SALSA|nr:T-cell surface glycoprotein CD3 epsilon chain isoform 1 precursor [Salmo salar]ABO10202.1 CD3epsilon [Salmo salar]ABO10203.1 CD3epsilon [Salmo salar]|eukprot:NP_001117094.1 T-cell surface glycoprotein CD3 epsilon chain isoform 1 precursor [Salmo salar]
MNRDGVYGGLVFLLLIMTSVEGGGDVSFWRTTVTLTCPDKGDWYDNTIKMNEEESKEIKMDYDESKKNVYQCKYLYDQYDTEKTTYQFYFKGKVCKDCYELNPTVVAGAIIGDLLVTGGVILIVYLRARKKSGPAAPQKPTSRSAGRGPPVVPSPDYEPLSVATRSSDIYATTQTSTQRTG